MKRAIFILEFFIFWITFVMLSVIDLVFGIFGFVYLRIVAVPKHVKMSYNNSCVMGKHMHSIAHPENA